MTPYKADFSKVAILIKTFLRDQHLEEAVKGCFKNLPECQLIVVDDGNPSSAKDRLYDELKRNGHVVVVMPFDSGFGAKSNAGIFHLARPYLLVGSDDFSFDASVREGVRKLITVLDGEPEISVASGRVNGNPYEGWLLELDGGKKIVEKRISYNDDNSFYANDVLYHKCNLTVNFSLMRATMLGPGGIMWDDDVKIGQGEHGAQFVKIMRAGYHVAYVPGVEIREQIGKSTDVRYAAYRGRAAKVGRSALKRLGIEQYVLFGGEVELT